MNSNVFDSKQDMHINVDKGAYTKMRILFFKTGISLQEVFGEIINRLANEDPYFTSMLNGIKRRKLQLALKEQERKPSPWQRKRDKQRAERDKCELDPDKVYEMIDDADDFETTI